MQHTTSYAYSELLINPASQGIGRFYHQPGTRCSIRFPGKPQAEARLSNAGMSGVPYRLHELVGDMPSDPVFADDDTDIHPPGAFRPGDEVLFVGNRRNQSCFGIVRNTSKVRREAGLLPIWPRPQGGRAVTVRLEDVRYPMGLHIVLMIRIIDYLLQENPEATPHGLFQWVRTWMPRVAEKITDNPEAQASLLTKLTGPVPMFIGRTVRRGLPMGFSRKVEDLILSWDEITSNSEA